MSKRAAAGRTFGRTATSLVVGGALALGGLASAGAAAAAPACTSGYTCLFDATDGPTGTPRIGFSQSGLINYSGRTYYASSTSLDNSVNAVFYKFQLDGMRFYRDANGMNLITTYVPGEQGFRNWSSSNWNVASSQVGFTV
jgi:hypothetical protein